MLVGCGSKEVNIGTELAQPLVSTYDPVLGLKPTDESNEELLSRVKHFRNDTIRNIHLTEYGFHEKGLGVFPKKFYEHCSCSDTADEEPLLTLKNEEFLERMPDGGAVLKGFFKNGELCRVEETIGISYAYITRGYCYEDHEPVLAYEREEAFQMDSSGDIDHSRTNTSYEGYFHYKEGELDKKNENGDKVIQQKDDNGKSLLDLAEKRKRILLEKGNGDVDVEEEGATGSSHGLPFPPDTTVGPFKLGDAKAIKEHIGDSAMEHLQTFPHDLPLVDLPYVRVLSADQEKSLTLIFHPGGSRNRFHEFIVERYQKDTFPVFKKVDVREFKTGSGIGLGMDPERLHSIKGSPDTIVGRGDSAIHKYKVDIDDIGPKLYYERYKVGPAYKANYYFVEGELVRFRFGYEMP